MRVKHELVAEIMNDDLEQLNRDYVRSVQDSEGATTPALVAWQNYAPQSAFRKSPQG